MATRGDVRVRQLLGVLAGMRAGASTNGDGHRVVEVGRAPQTTALAAASLDDGARVAPAKLPNENWGQKTLLSNVDRTTAVQRKQWQITAIPSFAIAPAPALGTPRRDGDYLLWNVKNQVIYFALAVPRLVDVMVSIRREHVENTFKITGGSVTLTVSAYDRLGPQVIQRLRDRWHTVLQGGGTRLDVVTPTPAVEASRAVSAASVPAKVTTPVKPVLPRYEPLTLRALEAKLETDPAFLAGTVSVRTSADIGAATFLLPLSELGAQAWKNALDQGRGDLIAGFCQLDATYYATSGTNLTVEPIRLSATLGSLLRGRGPEIMQVLDAQTTIDARVIVSGHQTLESVSVDWRPTEGHAPEALMFGSEGGTYNGPITSQHIEQVAIDWSAQIRFKPVNWPIVKQQGRLSVANADWTLQLKPESWVTEYSVFVVLLDAAGIPVPEETHASDPNNRVHCEVRFSAAFLEGGAAIVSMFEPTSQTLTKVAFPLPPGATAGEVKLTVFSQRADKTNLKTRVVHSAETFVLITIYSNATIEFTTNASEAGESLESALIAIVSQLR